jgi:4,5-DOPA dioxygenase extradiol
MTNPDMPLLFIGHGSPMNAIQDNDFTQVLKSVAQRIIKPRLILVISAHWQTEGTCVTAQLHPRQIYDFYGFPEELYEVKYHPSGSPEDARNIVNLGKDIPVEPDDTWGIDHGSWSVLKHMYPAYDIPVIQISLDMNKTPGQHYMTAKILSELRNDNVLIIGSGNIVHNLSLFSYEQYLKEPFDWAVHFDERVKENLLKKQDNLLIDYASSDEREIRLSMPTTEHYLPLLYIESLRNTNEGIEFIYEGIHHQSVSMRSFLVVP